MNPALERYLVSFGVSKVDLSLITQVESTERYKIYTIRQGSKERVIEEPTPTLKKAQQAIIPLLEKFPFHSACMARKGHGIVDNANIHSQAQNLLRIDVKQCYPSIDHRLVLRGLLRWDNPEITDYVADIIDLCLLRKSEDRYVLPTGAPTSPILCNIALTGLDELVSTIAQEYGYRYSRYIDDLHFSTPNTQRHWVLKEKIEEAIKSFGLTPNYKKDRWFRKGHADKLIVTGVSLGGKDKVPKDFNRMLRARLQNIARGGKDIDPETKGCLAYVRSIDPDKYQYFMDYYQKRRDFNVSNPRVSTGT